MADGEILPSNYKIFRRDNRGGGVLVVVSEKIPVHRLESAGRVEMVLLEM